MRSRPLPSAHHRGQPSHHCRPAGQPSTAPPPPAAPRPDADGRQIAWDRRRRALASFWREYRRDAGGMIGLTILVVMILVALAAPLIANSRGLNPGLANYPANAGPGWKYPLGTDSDGRSVLTQLIWGSRISLLIGFAATFLSMVIGAVIGIVAGHFGTLKNWLGRQTDNVTDAGHRLVPGRAVPSARDRAGQDARPVAARDHLRDRHHLLAGHGPDHPGPGARGRDPALPRTGPRTRRRPLASDGQARAAERHAAAAGEHDPDRGRHDPVRDHAVVPRPRRPDQSLLGRDAQRRVYTAASAPATRSG